MAYARQELDVEQACVGTVHKVDDPAEDWIAKLQVMIDKQQKAAQEAEEQRLQKEKEATEKAAYDEGKKAFQGAAKATKKDKRTIRSAAEKMSASQDDVDVLFSKLSTEELSVTAGRPKGKAGVAEVKNIFQAEAKRLVVAGQLIEGELSSLC